MDTENRNLAPANTETQSLATRLTNCIPGWVRLDDLDTDVWSMPPVKPNQGVELRRASEAHRKSLAPASYDQRKISLQELRLSTVSRNESEAEARASFEKLIADLADVPYDILRRACKAYANRPGTNFFPRGAGEVKAFTAPLMVERMRRAHRLNLMAKESDNAFDEADRCTPEQARQIMAEEAANSPLIKAITAALDDPS
jgi:hypothetical protein